MLATTFGNGPAVAALAALAWRTPWEGGPPIKRLKTDEVPKTPENGPKPGSGFDYTPEYLSCVRSACDNLRKQAGGGGTGGTGVEDPLGGGPSNKASQNRRAPENARKQAQTGLPF